MFTPQLGEDVVNLVTSKRQGSQPIPITWPKVASYKLDGVRTVTKHGDALSRSMKVVPNIHIREQLKPFQHLDGEIIIGEPTDPDVYRNTFSAWNRIQGEPAFRYYIFDELSSLEETYTRRNSLLMQRKDLPLMAIILPQVILNSLEEMQDMNEQALTAGYEGLILRNPNSTYKFGRCTALSQDMLKIKPFHDAEAEVLDTFERMQNDNEAFTNELGRTDRSTHQENKTGLNMLGGFICRDLKTGVVFRVAPGNMTHDEARALWLIRDRLVGRILVYRSMTGGVKDKPRHGRFKGWRAKADMVST